MARKKQISDVIPSDSKVELQAKPQMVEIGFFTFSVLCNFEGAKRGLGAKRLLFSSTEKIKSGFVGALLDVFLLEKAREVGALEAE